MIVDPFEENIRFCVYLLRANVRMQCARPIIMCVPNVVNVTTTKSFAAAKDNPRPSLDNSTPACPRHRSITTLPPQARLPVLSRHQMIHQQCSKSSAPYQRTIQSMLEQTLSHNMIQAMFSRTVTKTIFTSAVTLV